jgi:type I restriction enzyme S subunit
MGEWKEYKLSDITEIIGGGTPKTTMPKYWDGDIPWLSVVDFNNGRKLVFDTEKKITKKGLEESSTKLLKKGQLILSARGTVGALAMLDRDMAFNQSCYGLNAKPYITFNDYLYYLLRDNIATLTGQAHGAVFDTITRDTFDHITVSLPPLPEQKSIASILNSPDDKIDLLHRQNKTLETLAETLFRQWFVEEAEGLENKTLDELIVFDPKGKVSSNIEYTFFDMKCLSNSSMAIADGIKRTVNSGPSFRNGDTLLAKITPCLENGKTGFMMNLEEDELARGSTEFIVMRAKEGISPYFVYCLARYSDFRNTAILSMTGTSGRQRVQTAVLKDYEIKYSKDAMEKFHSFCIPQFLKIRHNQTQIRTLTRLRDMLLPKLMSGEVRVKR